MEEKKYKMVYSIEGYTPKQGDIIWLNFNPSAGREIQKKRPALVISSNAYNGSTGFILVCPISTSKKERPGFVPLTQEHSIRGKVNAMQIKGFDFLAKEREVRFVEKATATEVGMVAQIVGHIFSFDSLLSE
ncbi:type II toxin-antitoxin system PemK/MazF family toxin [Desemzia sp. FAM 23991]|uniref:type II toxin-antitoxin system PemK/MazF family toxin n=1 Tax=unclassified Desemzia TaxID=2685243 RepID=UPI003889FB5D